MFYLDDYFLSMSLTSINGMLMLMMTLTRYLLGDLESLIFFRAMTGFAIHRTTLHEDSFIWYNHLYTFILEFITHYLQ